MKNIAVLVSGGGTNLQALIDYEIAHKEDCPYTISLVVSSSKNAYALERGKNANIKTEIASPYSVMGKEIAEKATIEEKRLAVSNKVLELCKENDIEVIVLAGFLTVLSGDIVNQYSNIYYNF